MKKLLIYLLLASLVVLLYDCSSEKNTEEKKVVVKKVQDVTKIVSEQLADLLDGGKNKEVLVLHTDTLLAYSFFKPLYTDKYTELFSSSGKLNALGDSLIEILKGARFYGLIPDDYHFQKIDSLKKIFYNVAEESYDAYAIAKADILLCDAYFKFGAHLNKGRFYPDSLLLEWNPNKLDTNWTSILQWGLKTKNIRKAFDSLEPKHEGYVLLKQELKKYIIENEKINWDSVSFVNVTDTVKLYENIKQRLIITDDYDSAAKISTRRIKVPITPRIKDSLVLAEGIKSFQKKMNLEPDGKLGKYTKRAFSQNKEMTIRQMEMALERWRWEPKEYPKKYFWVNIPSCDLHVFEWDKKQKKDTLVLLSNVVVGKPENQTPVLKSKINYLIIYPYWKVPYSIAWKEILPAVQHDTSYLRRKGFEVLGAHGKVVDASKIKWKKYNKENLPYSFRQVIGEDNSLGILKFNFNSRFGVYMHDTNSKKYFKTFYRWQSHGCIRLEQYYEAARFIIRDDTLKIPYDTLDTWLATPNQQKINLRKQIPIYVKYFSTIADSTGLHRYIDIYRKDEQMLKMLYKSK
ncbi:MAG TPA: L,D-transpeptidase family protein [Bacteroidia bacterium]|nr:L,D-transpeptidase family protein [Bacteroidia bacterium]